MIQCKELKEPGSEDEMLRITEEKQFKFRGELATTISDANVTKYAR